MSWRGLRLILLAAGALGAASCQRAERHTKVLVLAASSLTEAFAALEQRFEAQHPEADVVVSAGGSQALRLQVEFGAPADVFASANVGHAQALAAAGWVEPPEVFAHNTLVVVVPRDNPAGLARFADLPRAQRLVLGAPEVPVGQYTERLLDRAAAALGPDFAQEVRAHVVSRESNVRQALARVELGEADAAIVYRTDVRPGRQVNLVEIPAQYQEPTACVLSVVTRAPQPALARAFRDLVHSEAGQAQLSALGFDVEAAP